MGLQRGSGRRRRQKSPPTPCAMEHLFFPHTSGPDQYVPGHWRRRRRQASPPCAPVSRYPRYVSRAMECFWTGPPTPWNMSTCDARYDGQRGAKFSSVSLPRVGGDAGGSGRAAVPLLQLPPEPTSTRGGVGHHEPPSADSPPRSAPIDCPQMTGPGACRCVRGCYGIIVFKHVSFLSFPSPPLLLLLHTLD
jgi:hypothetical protein